MYTVYCFSKTGVSLSNRMLAKRITLKIKDGRPPVTVINILFKIQHAVEDISYF